MHTHTHTHTPTHTIPHTHNCTYTFNDSQAFPLIFMPFLRNLYVTVGHVYTFLRACACSAPCTCVCMHGRVSACKCVCVCVCSLGLFSVVSLIMRKLFNVCLPVERGRECETVIAERESEREIWGREPDRHSCSCSVISLMMTPIFASRSIGAGGYLRSSVHSRCSSARLRDLSTSVCRWRGGGWRMIGVFYLRG